jgi:uncharacterized protein YndB with AHSA1/START domain
MSVDTASGLSLTRIVAASPEAVFEAWTRPDVMKEWACPDPTADVEVDIDLRVGGAYSIRMGFEGGAHTAVGVYREIDPPRRLVYTWDWKDGDHRMGVDTVVTVEFVAVDGGTEVRLTHEGFPALEAKTGHEEGWTACLDRLAARVA